MVVDKLSGQQVITDYFQTLLSDVDSGSSSIETDTTVPPLARVKPEKAMAILWRGPLTPAQKLCSDLMLLSYLQHVTGSRLRRALLNALQIVK